VGNAALVEEHHEVADRVMFFDQGCIAHEAPPAEFFGNPASERIAAFIGRMGH